jgi:hypothetical protein
VLQIFISHDAMRESVPIVDYNLYSSHVVPRGLREVDKTLQNSGIKENAHRFIIGKHPGSVILVANYCNIMLSFYPDNEA